jgi:hypothetical protein
MFNELKNELTDEFKNETVAIYTELHEMKEMCVCNTFKDNVVPKTIEPQMQDVDIDFDIQSEISKYDIDEYIQSIKVYHDLFLKEYKKMFNSLRNELIDKFKNETAAIHNQLFLVKEKCKQTQDVFNQNHQPEELKSGNGYVEGIRVRKELVQDNFVRLRKSSEERVFGTKR